MADDVKKTSNLLIILPTVFSLLSAIGVAYVGYRTKNLEANVERDRIAFEQSKFDSELRNRDAENLKIIVPKIVSKDEQEVKVGMATLFVLFQSRTNDVLKAVKSSLPEQQQIQVDAALKQAQQLQTQTDQWIIIVGGDKTIQNAKPEMDRAIAAGYAPTLYLKDGWYRTTVGPFPTQSDGDRTNIAVRASLREGAYVVNLKTWCPNPKPSDQYTDCKNQ
jgi:hypothetical protein